MIGFLHTADVHTPTFDQLVDEVGGAETARYSIVDAQLLADAQAHGITDSRVTLRLDEHLADLSSRGVTVAVCTCSTIGGLAEESGAKIGLATMRVDRAMAEAAVAAGPEIAVVATAASTLEPTRDLLMAVAQDAGATPNVEMHLCEGAWDRFLADDQEGYLHAIARTCETISAGDLPVSVIVLAQASMAAVSEQLSLPIPVLSSPALAVEAAVQFAAAKGSEGGQ